MTGAAIKAMSRLEKEFLIVEAPGHRKMLPAVDPRPAPDRPRLELRSPPPKSGQGSRRTATER